MLGRGGFGVVRLCEYRGKPEKSYALKYEHHRDPAFVCPATGSLPHTLTSSLI